MKATAKLHELGPEPLARQHHPHDARRRHARRLHRGPIRHRPHLEPDDLRQGDLRPATPTTSRSPSSAPARSPSRIGATPPEQIFFELAIDDLRDAADLFAAVHERTDGVDGFVLARGLAAARRRRRGDDRGGGGAPRQGRTRQPLHQDPGHRGRPAGDRGVDLRRHPDQRHAAVRRRAVPRRRRRLPARDRAPDRSRTRPRRRLGRLDLHEPLGRRRRRGGAGRAAQPARPRDRLPRLQGLPRAARLAAHAAPDERGRAAAAAALGEHRHQGPRSLRRPLHRGLRLAVHRQHDARADAARVRRPRRGRRPGRPSTVATPSRCWRSSRAPASTSTRWRRASRRRARRRSSSRGTRCWRRSSRRSGRRA